MPKCRTELRFVIEKKPLPSTCIHYAKRVYRAPLHLSDFVYSNMENVVDSNIETILRKVAFVVMRPYLSVDKVNDITNYEGVLSICSFFFYNMKIRRS